MLDNILIQLWFYIPFKKISNNFMLKYIERNHYDLYMEIRPFI